MTTEDNQELQGLLDNTEKQDLSNPIVSNEVGLPEPRLDPAAVETFNGKMHQWSGDGTRFFPTGETTKRLVPSVYEIQHAEQGVYFEKIPIKTEGLIRFPQTNSETVLDEIQKFWDREDRFKAYELAYKRGIMLWGPPGSGKSCTVQLITKDVIERKGIVIKFTHPDLFMRGMRKFREIEPETPVVVLMEDIDSIINNFSESSVLNILDGVDKVEKVVFLATTNYPEKLGARIINRPSRFDKRFKIGHPNEESRRLYLNHIIGGEEKAKALEIDVDQWVEDTEKFSLAHLKELFVAVVILGDEYEDAINTLGVMKEQVMADDEFEKKNMGFFSEKKSDRR